jgi:hypothetical protein
MTHLHKLAKHWGLTQEDPDFLRKYPNERVLCQVLVEQSHTHTLEDVIAQARVCWGGMCVSYLAPGPVL